MPKKTSDGTECMERQTEECIRTAHLTLVQASKVRKLRASKAKVIWANTSMTARNLMSNTSMTTRNFSAIADIVQRIMATTQVLAKDGEAHEASAKLETIHEDTTVQDNDRAEDWILRCGAYFDMLNTHQHKFQHYFVWASNGTANPKVSPMSVQDDAAEEIAKAEQVKGDWLTRI